MTTDQTDTQEPASGEDPWADVYPNPPPGLLSQVERRLDYYLYELCEYMRVAPTGRVRLAMLGIAGECLHTDLMRKRAASRAQRKRRVLDALQYLQDGQEVRRGLVDSIFDDQESQLAGLGKLTWNFLGASAKLQEWLSAEAERLGPPSQGDHTSVIPEPKQVFLIAAERVWRVEAHVEQQKRATAWNDWSTLLFEVTTGEPEQTLAKARRSLAEARRSAVTRDTPKS